MKLQIKIVLFALMGLYCATRWARVHLAVPGFFRNHFTDLLFIPVQLLAALWLTRLVRRNKTIRVAPVWIALQVVFVSLLFEWYMPQYGAESANFTGDPVDVCMYVIGGMAFFCLQHWEAKLQNPKLRIS